MLSANQIEDIRAQAMACEPSEFRDLCLIYPIKVRQAARMGYSKYNMLLGLLIIDEATIVDTIKEKTGETVAIEQVHPLEYLLASAALNDTFLLELQESFSTFIKEEVLLLPKINAVAIGNPADRRLITEENFRDFQDILRLQNDKEITEPPPENETFGQRKMRLLREQVAAVKKKQAQKKGEKQSFAELMEIAETFGIDMEHSLYAYYKLVRRHQLREKWDQDIQMMCAGADSSKIKAQYWGESLNE